MSDLETPNGVKRHLNSFLGKAAVRAVTHALLPLLDRPNSGTLVFAGPGYTIHTLEAYAAIQLRCIGFSGPTVGT